MLILKVSTFVLETQTRHCLNKKKDLQLPLKEEKDWKNNKTIEKTAPSLLCRILQWKENQPQEKFRHATENPIQ